MKLKLGLLLILSMNVQQLNADTTTSQVTGRQSSASNNHSTQLPTHQHAISTEPRLHFQNQLEKSAFANKENIEYEGIATNRSSPVSPWTLPSLVFALALLLWVISRSQRHG